MANTYLTRTPSSTGNRRILTISCWFKRSNINTTQTLFANGGNSYNRDYISLESNQLVVARYDGGYQYQIKLNRLFRDTNSWYHLMVAFNTTEDSSDNRIKIYINGVRETSFATNTRPSLNRDTWYNYSGKLQNIGVDYDNAGNDFDGLMSHVHWCDGAALAPTVFGETDSTTGEWKIKTSPSFTPGTNGFTILKDGNTITDQSANSNNFSLGGGTLTNTKDCPSNVFATLNPLDVMKQSGGIYVPTFSNGNTTMSSSATNNYQTFGSIAVDTGKYYWEMKCPNGANGGLGSRIGLFHGDNKVHSGSYYYGPDGYNVHQNGSIYTNGSSTAYMAGFSNNIIITFALDKTNGKSYVGANGSWSDGNGNTNQSFANAVAVETKLSITMPDKTTYAMFDVYGSTIQHINFGNGFFGTTAITTNSGNGYAGAEGASKFNYQPPSGYSALSTKGLNS